MNSFLPLKQAIIFNMKIDNLIPFIAPFSIGYFLYHLFLVLTAILLFMYSEKNARKYISALILSMSIAIFFYIFFPVKMIKPPIETTDIFSQIVVMLRSFDSPYNVFPSLHAAWSLIIFWYSSKKEFLAKIMSSKTAQLTIRIIILLFALLFSASAILIKQHYFIDILAGFLLGAISIFIVSRLEKVYI